MKKYAEMTLSERQAEYAAVKAAYEQQKALGLKLNMARGKPCRDQLDMVTDIFNVIILIAGVFMETSSAIIILTPVFLPLVRALGISTLHFGILFVVGIAIGMITPPVAINLFVASGITGLSLEKISKAVVPYLIGLIVVFLAIVYLPLFIPGFIG